MGWKMSRLSSSLWGLLREPDSLSTASQALEDIREAMLTCMSHCLNGSSTRPAVWGKVLYAKDIQSLWYLRSDVMQMLSQHSNEAAASRALDRITPLFNGHIPPLLFRAARQRR